MKPMRSFSAVPRSVCFSHRPTPAFPATTRWNCTPGRWWISPLPEDYSSSACTRGRPLASRTRATLHGVVALMAGVFVDAFAIVPVGNLALPRLGVEDRILDREAIEQPVLGYAREALRDLRSPGKVSRMILPGVVGVEVRRFDHQRVAVIVGDRIAEQRLDRCCR